MKIFSWKCFTIIKFGILHVATERPEDPVEALIDFLLCKTFEEKYNEKWDKNLSLHLDTDDNN